MYTGASCRHSLGNTRVAITRQHFNRPHIICIRRLNGYSTQRRPALTLASSQQTQGREETDYSPRTAPSSGSSSRPPPPPPPPPPQKKPKYRRRGWGIFAFLVAGAALWWAYLDSQMPDVYRDSDNGLQYVTTKGGNKVVVGEDSIGRVYFIDASGNFYYDTGSSDLGFYVVTRDSQVFNIFEDGEGERQTVYVGSFDDLKTQDIKQLGGIPVEQLEKSFGKTFDGTVTGFVDRAPKGQAPKLASPESKAPRPAIAGYEVVE